MNPMDRPRCYRCSRYAGHVCKACGKHLCSETRCPFTSGDFEHRHSTAPLPPEPGLAYDRPLNVARYHENGSTSREPVPHIAYRRDHMKRNTHGDGQYKGHFMRPRF